MTARARYLVALAAGVTFVNGSPVSGQRVASVRTAFMTESYKFRTGLAFDRLDQFTLPLAVDVDFGRFGRLALSSGFTRVKMRSADPTLFGNQELSGALDTELRWTYPLIPDRLFLVANGALPTGINNYQSDELAVVGAISTDVIGFAAPSLGSGGSVGGGFVGAVPVGRFAFGFGGTYRAPMPYRPVAGQGRLLAGSELRVRGGFEGPLAPRTYLRVAAIFATRQKDNVGGETLNGVGNRFVGYGAVNQGFRNLNLTLYAFDILRADPQIEATASGAALLPRGNLFAAGLEGMIPIAPSTSLNPRIELRLSDQAADTSSTKLEPFGESIRFGVGIRHQVSPHFALVGRGSGARGRVFSADNSIRFSGYRAALNLEWIP